MAFRALQTRNKRTPASRGSYGFAICLVAFSLLINVPAFGQTAAETQPPRETSAETTLPTYLISPAIDKQIADILLGICYFGFPTGLALAFWLHDKRAHDRLTQLNSQIALLEQIWNQNAS
jgi:hypothetical protein